MGYSQDAPSATLAPEHFVEDASREITEAVGRELKDRVVEKTPVARIPAAYGGNVGAWVADRDGRKPGTLKDSWELGPVEGEEVKSVSVESLDPVAILVEEDTRPHLIAARNAGALRLPVGADFVFRRVVHHPGTQGQHMMRDSLAEIEARWEGIADGVLERMAAGR